MNLFLFVDDFKLKKIYLKVKLTASTCSVNATASIAELFATPAAHVVTTLSFLDPEIAEGALLVLSAAHELLEGLIVLVWVSANLEFIARLPHVVRGLTGETVALFTNVTTEIVAIYFRVKNKAIIAIGTRAPRDVLLQT